MTDDDKKLSFAILEAVKDPRELARLIREYYADGDRSDRATRELLYLHLGLLSGVLERVLDAKDLATAMEAGGVN